MKKYYLSTIIMTMVLCSFAHAQSPFDKPIAVTIDLLNVQKDKVFVEVLAPELTSNEIVYHFAKIIHGTYAIADYGRFVDDVKAYDQFGNSLAVARNDSNKVLIKEAGKLKR